MIAFAYYLLKVIICSGVLFLYYHLALRNKLFHQWNRFYLLISVFVSLVAPLVQISIMHQITGEPNKAIQMLQVLQSTDGYLESVTISTQKGFTYDQWLLMAYLLISLLLLLSVLLSVQKIILLIRSHTIQWIEKIKFIGTHAKGTPFSFFNFIFWNEDIDIQTPTGKQIFQHELVHVKEKHTLDKLLIQFVLIAFWCNPFFWLTRRELQLIHEFIADKKSVGEQGTAALAAMILSSSYPAQFNSLTNQFFQTSIKRRLAMLTKIQNVRMNYISRILALPIIALTVLAFTLRTKNVSVPPLQLDKQITVVIDAGHGIKEDGQHSGASVDGVSEDNIVLNIAHKIKELNRDEKLKIVLTRTSDKIVDLQKRVDIAKENKADLFISLHVAAKMNNLDAGLTSEKSLQSGFGVYVSNKQTLYQTPSETLGSALQQELNSIYPTNPYLLKRKVGIWVLDQNVCPSVMIECGFLTDSKDREFIIEENNQTAIAEKVLQAIERYAFNQQVKATPVTDTTPHKQQIKESTINRNTSPAKKQSGITVNPGVAQPLYLVNDKEITRAEADKIDPATIQSVNVLKGDTATTKYGKKGANGVIEIHLKPGKTIKEATLISVPKDATPGKQPFFTKVETEASINKEAWTRHLTKTLLPAINQAAEKGMNPGTYIVQVKFVVMKDGSVLNAKALNDPGYDLAQAAVKTVQTGPKWNPGLQNGKAVNSFHTQPITFVIQEK